VLLWRGRNWLSNGRRLHAGDDDGKIKAACFGVPDVILFEEDFWSPDACRAVLNLEPVRLWTRDSVLKVETIFSQPKAYYD